MNESVESGHVDAQPTKDLTEARNQALAAHQNAVEKNADENNVDNTNVEPTQDTRASAPVQAETPEVAQPGSTPEFSAQSPDNYVETPQRHDSNSSYDEEGRDKTVADANFDVDEKDEDADA